MHLTWLLLFAPFSFAWEYDFDRGAKTLKELFEYTTSHELVDSVVNDLCEKYHELCLEETHAEMMTLKREMLEHATNRDRSLSADVLAGFPTKYKMLPVALRKVKKLGRRLYAKLSAERKKNLEDASLFEGFYNEEFVPAFLAPDRAREMIPLSLHYACSLARSLDERECEMTRRRQHFSSFTAVSSARLDDYIYHEMLYFPITRHLERKKRFYAEKGFTVEEIRAHMAKNERRLIELFHNEGSDTELSEEERNALRKRYYSGPDRARNEL